jgi:hypothetical protein
MKISSTSLLNQKSSIDEMPSTSTSSTSTQLTGVMVVTVVTVLPKWDFITINWLRLCKKMRKVFFHHCNHNRLQLWFYDMRNVKVGFHNFSS